MNMDEAEISCPHCGEPMAVPVDPTNGEKQEFIEDCAVCCKPITIFIRFEDNEPIVSVDRSQ